ncbi:MAG TPA: class I SAM-dependent rRNA methyltransferase, partial [bacterium]|nr:class I SAM-dependent rRNA methyltransferase [bacterium]
MHKVTLLPDKDKLPRNRHPWVFSGAVKDIEGSPATGDIVALHDAAGQFIAYGHFNKDSKIQVRLLSWDESRIPDEAWFRGKIRDAVRDRAAILRDGATDTCRLIYSEG